MGNKALTNYQMARQLWDVETDCEALWTDYFARRCGPAAATMREFYESLEQMLSNATELKLSGLIGATPNAIGPIRLARMLKQVGWLEPGGGNTTRGAGTGALRA